MRGEKEKRMEKSRGGRQLEVDISVGRDGVRECCKGKVEVGDESEGKKDR